MAQSDRLKIAYLCDQSPLIPSLYSGGNARIYNALQKHVGDVTILDGSWHMAEPLRLLVTSLPEALHLRSRWRLHYALAPLIARGLSKQIAAGGYDVVFGAYSLQSMSCLKTDDSVLKVFTADATQTTYRESEIGDSFGSYWSLSRALDGWVKRCETRALHGVDLMLWPSDWQQELADAAYGLDSNASEVVPWGAGIDAWPEPRDPVSIGADDPVRLLVVGRNWFAKGGPLAFETMTLLRDSGVDARLTVIGCTPPEFHMNEWVTVHPNLDKTIPEDMALFSETFGRSHFLIMPSHESYGFAFCEASAYGVPALCLRVGGIPVRDGVNGFALPADATPSDFSNQIKSLISDPMRYNALRASTRKEFEDRLNWDSWGQAVAKAIASAMERKSEG